MFMCIMIVMEMQWQDGLINVQHFVNEVFLYLFCVSMMLFTGVLEQSRQSVALGWLLIGLCCIMIIYNLGVILVDTLSFLHLLYRRYYARYMAKKCSKVILCQHLCTKKGYKDRESKKKSKGSSLVNKLLKRQESAKVDKTLAVGQEQLAVY